MKKNENVISKIEEEVCCSSRRCSIDVNGCEIIEPEEEKEKQKIIFSQMIEYIYMK